MNDFVKIVEYRDNDNTSKRITVEFSQSVKRIEKISLNNVEITENGEKEIVSLCEKINRIITATYSAGKHDFIFEFGNTLFNDGAEFSISIIKSNSSLSEKYSFILKDNQWEAKEDN